MATDTVMEVVRGFEPEMVAIRRDLHRHPEVGFEVARTAGLVADRLRAWGVDEVVEGVGRTGVVGTVHGRLPGHRGAVLLRADMDALLIHERTGLAHASAVPGRMHACGHDGHTAMLLGAARYLAAHRGAFAGSVRLVFQPAEEGHGGALAMLADGLIERFPAEAAFGLHNLPGLPIGRFATRLGPFLAGCDTWTATFRGAGGHGGSGHLAADVTAAQAHFVLASQGIAGRDMPALQPAVVGVGHVGAGDWGAPSVLPAEAVVRGTARCFDAGVRDLLERRLGEAARASAAMVGAAVEFVYERQFPPLVNDAAYTALAASATAAVGEAGVDAAMAPVTTSDDFACVLERSAGNFMAVGNGAGPGTAGLHTPRYDFDDAALSFGTRYWIALVQRWSALP